MKIIHIADSVPSRSSASCFIQGYVALRDFKQNLCLVTKVKNPDFRSVKQMLEARQVSQCIRDCIFRGRLQSPYFSIFLATKHGENQSNVMGHDVSYITIVLRNSSYHQQIRSTCYTLMVHTFPLVLDKTMLYFKGT